MSKDLSPSQWDLRTRLFRKHTMGEAERGKKNEGMGGIKKKEKKNFKSSCEDFRNLYNSQLSKLLAAFAGLFPPPSVCKTHKISTVPLKSV